ncbi:sensor histidine kinase [Salmonirosea aquatica]|uniref:histidine kinase n=1 Tax=Salmonirosea aquatica TaxID=2654236 RepID=A0A7C9FY98_9BACT|nr:HAMP domain-containing protein [Cytophagaceae bacterium SJW1-29]
MNIKARLTMLFTLLVASIMLFFCVAIYFFYDQYREQQFFSYLTERATTIIRLLEDVNGITEAEIKQIEEANSAILLGEEITIYDSQDSVIFDSGKDLFPISKQILEQVRQGQEQQFRQGNREVVMLRHVHEVGEPRWVVVAYATDLIGLNKLNRLRDILALGWLLSLILVSGAGWIFSKDALRPVSEIIDQVNNISAGNLHDRLRVGNGKDELAQLSMTFNQMLSRLELAFTVQRSFVSHASHELRTPLAVMMGEVEVALMKERTGAAYQETLSRVLDEVKELSELVNNLLELARTDAGQTALRKVRADEILWQAQAHVTHKYPGYEVEIRYDQEPENEEQLLIRGDEGLLRTAFINLMENACKYSSNQQAVVRIEIESNRLLLHFQDQGVGIDAEHIPLLFDTFYRITTTQDRKGYGIGLALVKRILTLHKGTIEVTSQPGVGSDFKVILPLF